jgi:hypothetical protein
LLTIIKLPPHQHDNRKSDANFSCSIHKIKLFSLQLSGHRIVSGTTPRVAAHEPAHSQPDTGKTAMLFQRVQTVLRATGFKPAAATGSTDCMQQGRNSNLIPSDEQPQQRLHALSIPALRASLHHSASSSANVASAALKRATVTHHTPSRIRTR